MLTKRSRSASDPAGPTTPQPCALWPRNTAGPKSANSDQLRPSESRTRSDCVSRATRTTPRARLVETSHPIRYAATFLSRCDVSKPVTVRLLSRLASRAGTHVHVRFGHFASVCTTRVSRGEGTYTCVSASQVCDLAELGHLHGDEHLRAAAGVGAA